MAAELATDLERGLTRAEAEARLARLGRNELAKDAPPPLWRRVLEQMRDPLTVLLLVAAALSLLVWDLEGGNGWPYEALTVLTVVAVNAILAVAQQGRAERSLQALRALTPMVDRKTHDDWFATIDGWHVNVFVLQTEDATPLLPYVVTPTTPYRVFAGA